MRLPSTGPRKLTGLTGAAGQNGAASERRSFLGFGLQYPTFDWGDMLNNGITYLQDGYWWQVYPVGIAIIVVVMACNLLGDALRDALDVRLRRR